MFHTYTKEEWIYKRNVGDSAKKIENDSAR